MNSQNDNIFDKPGIVLWRFIADACVTFDDGRTMWFKDGEEIVYPWEIVNVHKSN